MYHCMILIVKSCILYCYFIDCHLLIKCQRGRSACVWGRMSWCLLAIHSLAPPFFVIHQITSRSHHGGCINYFYPITVRALVVANGSPHSRHLHWPWLQTGTSILGAHHECTWHHSIKGQAPLALCSLNMTPVTSRSKTRTLTLTLARLSIHMTHTH